MAFTTQYSNIQTDVIMKVGWAELSTRRGEYNGYCRKRRQKMISWWSYENQIRKMSLCLRSRNVVKVSSKKCIAFDALLLFTLFSKLAPKWQQLHWYGFFLDASSDCIVLSDLLIVVHIVLEFHTPAGLLYCLTIFFRPDVPYEAESKTKKEKNEVELRS